MRTLLCVVLLALSIITAASAQDPAPTTNQPTSQPAIQSNDPDYTLRTQSNVVLVPTTVQTKKGDMIYALKPEQFVVEDNGVPQTIHLDEDTDSLGLTLVVLVQCSRAAMMEFTKLSGLGTMVDALVGGAPRQIAVASYGKGATLLGDSSAEP